MSNYIIIGSACGKLALVHLLVVIICHQEIAANFNPYHNPLNCYVERGVRDLGPECHSFVVYRQLEWSRMTPDESYELSRRCSCKMLNLDWENVFDREPCMRRIYHMVEGLIMAKQNESEYPPQLWSDIDVLFKGYSIYLSTRDYFKRVVNNSSLAFFKPRDFESQPYLLSLRKACITIAGDKLKYYQYLEILQKINPDMFIEVLKMNHMINMVYQASKACKMFILHNLKEFMKKPEEKGFFASHDAVLTLNDIEDYNMIKSNSDIDLNLQDLSLKLWQCRPFHQKMISLQTLESECPMMMNESLSLEWIREHSMVGERSLMALKCGCQLLVLNSSWAVIIEDENLKDMSQALTLYMNQNQPPVSNNIETITWEYYVWFERVMDKFIKNKKMSMKELIKYRRGTQDPETEINHETRDEVAALNTLRTGCNRLMFNHIKGSKKGDTIRPIKYLDNLRLISRDPLFVFHLTLLDKNLFKLHALSKMCQPVVQ